MSDNIPEWLRPYCTQNSYTPTEEDIESLDPQSRNEMLLKYFALNYSGGGGGAYKYDAFKARTDISINKVTSEMLQGIADITDYAFNNCTSLASITIPNSVTSIGQSAFSYCTSLTSVTIPNSVTSIASYAFYYCTSLASITIPNSVTSIGGNAFYYCTSLASLTVEAATPPTLGSNVFYGTDANLTIYVPAESVDAYKSDSGWSTYASKIQAIPSD